MPKAYFKQSNVRYYIGGDMIKTKNACRIIFVILNNSRKREIL